MIGSVVAGRYTLEAEIGRGGMGAVWRGRDEVLGRTVALKRIGATPGGITADAVRAEREAKLAARLNHSNVVAVFDLVAEAAPGGHSQQWLVMEYVEGTDLGNLIRRQGRLSPDEAAPILAATASALAAAHAAGIVHRDVKPSNILVTPQGQVKLSDFGIARTASDPALTQTGLVTGSPGYLAPEVASGHPATPASDVWSWGATLFHAVEGRPPYETGDNVLGALYRIVHEEPPQAQAAGWLAPVLAATMTRDPAERWPIARAEEFLDGGAPGPIAAAPAARRGQHARPLEGESRTRLLPAPPGAPVVPAAGAPAPPAPPAPAAPGRHPRRGWLPIVLGAAALLLVVAVAFVIGLQQSDEGDGGAATGEPTAKTGGSPTTAQPAAPTAESMKAFVASYLETVVDDPARAFEMLTPAFQQESGGYDGYTAFWGDVTKTQLRSVTADPDHLEVTYSYRYWQGSGPPTSDEVTLRLERDGDGYRIADEL